MQLLDHASISVPDLDAVRAFYDAIMAALGAVKVYDEARALGYGERCTLNDTGSTYLAVYEDGGEVSESKRHWCFRASTRAQVDRFHACGVETGGSSDGEPGLRADYHPGYYAAFLIDPAGNRLEAVCHLAA
jgi:catechol 2,3-dioxygenase-like lactoylglutathione lyase family enzyme